MSCALNMDCLTENSFVNSASRRSFKMYFTMCFTNRLNDFWATLYSDVSRTAIKVKQKV